MTDILVTSELADGARLLTLNRPHRLNALDSDLVHALRDAVRHAVDDDVRALVLTGEGRAFCAGADLKWLAKGVLADHAAHGRFHDALSGLCSDIEAAPLVVIAAVNGFALAGGLELVLCCDIVLAAKDAEIGDEHIRRNLLPGGGGSQRLPRRIGLARASYYLLSGRRMSGEEACRNGLAALAVDRDELAGAAMELATEIARTDREALHFMKQMIHRGVELPLREALSLELYLQGRYREASSAMDDGVAAFAGHAQEASR
jgi:enoyl-CoA hydratase